MFNTTNAVADDDNGTLPLVPISIKHGWMQHNTVTRERAADVYVVGSSLSLVRHNNDTGSIVGNDDITEENMIPVRTMLDISSMMMPNTYAII